MADHCAACSDRATVGRFRARVQDSAFRAGQGSLLGSRKTCWSRRAGAALSLRARPHDPARAHAPPIAFTIPLFLAYRHLELLDTRTGLIVMAVVNFMNYDGWEWGKIAAGGSLVMAPVLLFSLLVRRYLVSGRTAGAVKGD